MEALFYTIVVVGSVAAVLNLVVLFFLAITVVNLRETVREFMADAVAVMTHEPAVAPPPPAPRTKTWDEKYEEYVDVRAARLRNEGDDGLLPRAKKDIVKE